MPTGSCESSSHEPTLERSARVLSDDLVATHADLWMWPPAPGPPQPDYLRVALDDGLAVRLITEAFAPQVAVERPWLGALLIDTDAVPWPVVTDVTRGGPASAAGIHVCDMIVSIDGTQIETVAEVREQFSAHAAESAAALEVSRDGSAQVVGLTLDASPAVLPFRSPDLIYPVVSAMLSASIETDDPGEADWVLQLNQAAVLLHAGAWEEAVRALRAIEAPTGAGLGQGAVDYWLGIALAALGPSYFETARHSFSRAAAVPDARLFHNDGPWVAPRARARLGEFGAEAR